MPTTALPDDFLLSVKRLCVAARTTGGTAGRDDGLCAALDRVEQMLQAIDDPDWQAQATQRSTALVSWLAEREANARAIAQSKSGIDRAGWLEDAEYFAQAIVAVGDYHAGYEHGHADATREALAAAPPAPVAAGWIRVEDRLPVLPDDHEDDGRPVWTWDGQFVAEDEFVPTYEQPAGPTVGGWVRTGEWFASDTPSRVTHWMPRVAPLPPTPEAEVRHDHP